MGEEIPDDIFYRRLVRTEGWQLLRSLCKAFKIAAVLIECWPKLERFRD